MPVPAVFLDKDGTLVEDVPYNVDPGRIRLAPGAAEGLRLLHRAGFYYCPHHPAGAVEEHAVVCACRKPAPGLLLRAAREHGVDLARSWLVGDILDDVEAGRRAGCRTILLDNGHETEWVLRPERVPHPVASELLDAARLIADYGRREALPSIAPRRPLA